MIEPAVFELFSVILFFKILYRIYFRTKESGKTGIFSYIGQIHKLSYWFTIQYRLCVLQVRMVTCICSAPDWQRGCTLTLLPHLKASLHSQPLLWLNTSQSCRRYDLNHQCLSHLALSSIYLP